ncbi:MAG: T9SS type A sorting domain-containing protein [Candidatus Latescibacteria bacterium]|nr:T9SS type A sorting domain-containing protein [Candidatus Latescibacterota bacterium]
MSRLLPLLLLLMMCGQGRAQSAQVRVQGFNTDRISAQIGQVLTMEVFADLQGVSASGFSLFVSVPSGAFQVVDTDTNGVGTQPFEAGPLFKGAGVNRNILYSDNESPYNVLEGQQLQYSAVFGGGQDRQRTGSGVIATFKLRCIKPILGGRILVDNSPVLETFLTLADGLSIEPFRTVQGVEVSVTGLSVRDIPDVILLPDRGDSTTIGSLDNYLENILSPVDSIRWTFEPITFDSISVQIDPRTRVVKITPAKGWRGRRGIVWTATEAKGLLPGTPPLSASDASTIIVNNPPAFTGGGIAETNGLKRVVVHTHEDLNSYIPGVQNNNRSRALHALDLDTLIVDADIVDPQTELNFTVLLYNNGSDPPVLGEDDEVTDELLLWTRPDFSGVDSVKVLVQDGLLGEDSLRVVVEVEEVPDAPHFLLTGQTVRIAKGGEHRIALRDLLEDVDTPLDQLQLTWEDDPGGNFTAVLNAAGDSLIFNGSPEYLGAGQFVFRVIDPLDPENLQSVLVLNISSDAELPPVVTPGDLSICLTPPGVIPARPTFTVDLDDLLDDPDTPDKDIRWEHPFPTRSVIEIDGEHVLRVSEPQPDGFVGYEETQLIATDPGGQTTLLKLRIYSSDRRPVAGGLPDLHLERGEIHDILDLDDYYCDCNNLDEEMRWDVDGGGRRAFAATYSAPEFQVSIDPLNHKVTFAVGTTAAFRTETLVFQVTSKQEGQSSLDTMLVTIGDDGGQTGEAFQIKPLGALEVEVNDYLLLDLDDYVVVAAGFDKAAINWSVNTVGGTSSLAQVDSAHVLQIFGLASGTDTLTVAAQDDKGNKQSMSVTVRVLGQNETVKLQSIPDIQFIVNVPFTGLHLNEFVIDRQAHPDSALVWSARKVDDSQVIVTVGGDSVFAISRVVAQATVVFEVMDLVNNAVGRDTVRVIANDPSTASQPLKDLPPITFSTAQEDSSLFLDNFLPDGASRAKVRWSVSGQRVSSPFIDPREPHELHLKSVGDTVGVDTLRFVADLGGGYTAVGSMLVTITEPVDSSTLHLELVPNPFNPEFIDVFIVARRALAGTPNVVRSFEGSDSTVAVRQIEEDLLKRGALIWTGSVRLRPQATGTIFFSTQAKTSLGTALLDTASVAIAGVVAGKPVALEHGGTALWLPPGAAAGVSSVAMRTTVPDHRDLAAKTAGADATIRRRIELYPAGLLLSAPGTLRVQLEAGEVLCRRQGADWVPVAGNQITRLGTYAVMAGQTLATDSGVRPQQLWLGANYPNPFNPETLIPFGLENPGLVRLAVYNLAGQRVRLLLDEVRPAGQHLVRWDGFTESGDKAGSGVYLYRLEAEGRTHSRSMSLLK